MSDEAYKLSVIVIGDWVEWRSERNRRQTGEVVGWLSSTGSGARYVLIDNGPRLTLDRILSRRRPGCGDGARIITFIVDEQGELAQERT